MSRRSAAKAETRRLVLGAAQSLLRETGVEGCTMRRIGERAGVAPATVLVHFKNKVALLEAVLCEAIEAQFEAATASLPTDGGFGGRFVHLAAAFLSLYHEDRDLYRALIRDTSFEPENVDSPIGALNKRFLGFVAREVGKEQRAGRVRPTADPVMAASALFSLYLGTLMHFLRTPELEPATAVALLRVMVSDFLNGILTSGGGP